MSRVTDRDREAAKVWLLDYHTVDTDANLRRADSLAEAIATARAEERERCAQACEAEAIEDCPDNWTNGALHESDKAYNMAVKHCATAVRAAADKEESA